MASRIEEGRLHDWQDTKLWNVLRNSDKPEVEEVCTTLQTCMPEIQRILTHGGTSPGNFTLHDSQHSFRVAERMVDVLPELVLLNLSTYELALLLLSAYLHDIGMTPTAGAITSYAEYILFSSLDRLSGDALADFSQWIDDQEEEIPIPLAQDNATTEKLATANLVAAQYCRAKHVEWSEEWIDKNLVKSKLGTYAQWLIDLKQLCRSHHDGYQEIRAEIYDPKPVGSHGMIVHLRYLAAVLRVADVLEFDPERTPEVVFRHRNIPPESIIYWHKDHYITRKFENGRLTISARPPDAKLHRAVELMTDDIEAELQLVRRLDDEIRFEIARFQDEPLYHKWNIRPDVRRDIYPLDNSYEYILGAFRPNTQKLLNILSGTALYGSEIVAIRELLQNAFDAVCEQIALERLEKRDPADMQWEERLGNEHEVSLSLEIHDNRIWLICTDSGAGMSKTIISNYFLISGNSRRKDIRLLERRSSDVGFNLNRTGQFGIGVLSYFMIADLVQVYTKRSKGADDSESTGWYFETEGIGSFGELRKDLNWRRGTQIRLRLIDKVVSTIAGTKTDSDLFENQFVGETHEFLDDHDKLDLPMDLIQKSNFTDLPSFVSNILIYIKGMLQRIPCQLQLQILLNNASYKLLMLQPGWINRPMDWKSRVVDSMTPIYHENHEKDSYMSLDAQRNIEARRLPLAQLLDSISKSLTWEVVIGQLPNNLGCWRMCIPMFNVLGGRSPYFCDPYEESGEMRLRLLPAFGSEFSTGGKYLRIPEGSAFMSWKGIAINQMYFYESKLKGTVIEIDWQSNRAGVLSVSRRHLTLNEEAQAAIQWLMSQIDVNICKLAKANSNRIFANLGYILAERRDLVGHDSWLQHEWEQNDEYAIWKTIEFPLIDYRSYANIKLTRCKHLEWKGKNVRRLLSIPIVQQARRSPTPEDKIETWSTNGLYPDRVVEVGSKKSDLVLTPLWETATTSKKVTYFGGSICQFPPTWADVCVVFHYPMTYWNSSHILSSARNVEIQEWAIGIVDFKDPSPLKDSLLENREQAVAWLAALISLGGSNGKVNRYWKTLMELEKEFLNRVWQLIFELPGASEKPITQVVCLGVGYYPSILKFSPEYCLARDGEKGLHEIRIHAPHPGPEWSLNVTT